jgi:hypothetical protein
MHDTLNRNEVKFGIRVKRFAALPAIPDFSQVIAKRTKESANPRIVVKRIEFRSPNFICEFRENSIKRIEVRLPDSLLSILLYIVIQAGYRAIKRWTFRHPDILSSKINGCGWCSCPTATR